MLEGLAGRGLLIDGDWAGPGRGGTYAHHDPATGRHQADVGLASAREVDDAVRAARAAFPSWRRTPPHRRAAVLARLADLLDEHAASSAALNALDNGTPVSAMPSGHYAASWTRYYAGWVDKLDGEVLPVHDTGALDYTRTEPYGVVAAIVPWNGPMMGMGQKVAPALAAGNTVVVKPPELAPFGALRFAELALEAGLPAGVLNVVPGGAATGQALVGHPGVAKISFTGGTATAREVMAIAARHCTPLALELGGKSANIVFADADLDTAVPVAAVLGAGLLSGQGCALPTRLYVDERVVDEVVARVVAQVESLPIGDPLDPSTLVGPLVNQAACTRVLGVIERAHADGARLATGGRRLADTLEEGYYVAPTVFCDVDQHSDLATQEVFGPVLAVLPFADEDEVVSRANDSAFGLAAYLHTRDLSRALRLVEALEVGTVTVNGFPPMSPSAPFGGMKASGFGREGGRAGIEEFVQRKNVTLRY
ncbi:aldehyde dehydrogenase family protein [Rhabdothermincola salaria]|uniref:aldehyde dehydrogenase family protein n=1 Tax=Rhabdothermincola salaria TaxID=2903142 RepID=UPI0020183AE8|nr:aldehyde dehydrogenase family protein [Rhabdothermincola salaria]